MAQEIDLSLLGKVMRDESQKDESFAFLRKLYDDKKKTPFKELLNRTVGVLGFFITVIALIASSYLGLMRPLDRTIDTSIRNESDIEKISDSIAINYKDLKSLINSIRQDIDKINNNIALFKTENNAIVRRQQDLFHKMTEQIVLADNSVAFLNQEVEELWREFADITKDTTKQNRILERIHKNALIERGRQNYGF